MYAHEIASGGNSEERHISPTGNEPLLSNPHPVSYSFICPGSSDTALTLLIIHKNRPMAKEVPN